MEYHVRWTCCGRPCTAVADCPEAAFAAAAGALVHMVLVPGDAERNEDARCATVDELERWLDMDAGAMSPGDVAVFGGGRITIVATGWEGMAD